MNFVLIAQHSGFVLGFFFSRKNTRQMPCRIANNPLPQDKTFVERIWAEAIINMHFYLLCWVPRDKVSFEMAQSKHSSFRSVNNASLDSQAGRGGFVLNANDAAITFAKKALSVNGFGISIDNIFYQQLVTQPDLELDVCCRWLAVDVSNEI
ncbi:TPA: hypothetical protein ACGD8A_004778 [Serratia marcescens]